MRIIRNSFNIPVRWWMGSKTMIRSFGSRTPRRETWSMNYHIVFWFCSTGRQGVVKLRRLKCGQGVLENGKEFISFTNPEFCSQSLHYSMLDLPPRPLLLFEDVDVLFNENGKNESVLSVTISGLLIALDVLMAVNGIITLLMTNHVDKLDS